MSSSAPAGRARMTSACAVVVAGVGERGAQERREPDMRRCVLGAEKVDLQRRSSRTSEQPGQERLARRMTGPASRRRLAGGWRARRRSRPARAPVARRRRDGCHGSRREVRAPLARGLQREGLPRSDGFVEQWRDSFRSAAGASSRERGVARAPRRRGAARGRRPRGGRCRSRGTRRKRWSFCDSLRSALTDGVRAPASMREMYAYETPGATKGPAERAPFWRRRRLSRAPIVSAAVAIRHVGRDHG